jgi:hypothetical protein
MEGVSLYFDDPRFPVLGQKTAAGRTFPAGRGIPGGLPGDDIFRRKDERD